MAKVIIIHGTGGTPAGNWFPWLAKELEKLGHTTLVPRMPTPENQSLENWFKAFSEQQIQLGKSTIIIGHSIGAVFLLRLLERSKTPIKASIFVAGLTGLLNLPEFDSLNSTFVEGEYDWEKIKLNAGQIKCFSGDNDPYVPQKQGVELANRLGTNLYVIRNGGHLNAESGYLSFPLLLDETKTVLD